MDVDNPQIEEAMETDPPITTEETRPQLIHKDSILDPDGDEVMQGEEDVEEGGEGMYDEDIEIADVEEVEDGDYEVDVDVDVDVEGNGEEGDQGIGETQEESQATEGNGTETTTGGDLSSGILHVASPLASAPIARTEGTTGLDQVQDDTAGTLENGEPETAETNNQVEEDLKADNAVDQGEAVEAIQGEEHEGAHHPEDEGGEHEDAQHQEEEKGEHEEEEEAVEEEEYDLLTPQNLPPIILNLSNTRIALFNPISTDDDNASTIPVWFGDKLEELCEAPLTQVWSAIRGKLDEEGQGNGEDEMVIIEKLMDLKMGDVSPLPPLISVSRRRRIFYP
jgi:hypothetical protein